MAFRISLNKATKAAQLASKAKAGEDAKARDDKNALDKVMADVMDEHGGKNNVLGDEERDDEIPEEAFVPTGAKRHFTTRTRTMKSGPGTLAPEPGVGGFSGYAPRPTQFGSTRQQTAQAPRPPQEENVFATVIAKASNLPPNYDTRRVAELFADFSSMKIVNIEKLPPDRPSSASQRSRPSTAMKVVFDKNVTAQDLESVMYKLSGKKYLGKGYYLHLDRYRGSLGLNNKQKEEPFGAILKDKHGFAPPSDFGASSRGRRQHAAKEMVVVAHAPPDVEKLKLIHQTVEAVIEGGLEFEAALMEDPQVQEEERFDWLFDQKHPLNRYYRWRLFEIVSGGKTDGEVFHQEAQWRAAEDPFLDEYTTNINKLGQGSDYWAEIHENPMRSAHQDGENYPGRADKNNYGVFAPRSRTLLMWLIASFKAESMNYEEVGTISNVAINNAPNGLDEIVDILITNVFRPFALTPACVKDHEGGSAIKRFENAMNLVSDLLMAVSKQGGACYKYRQLIGEQLVERRVFEYLETIPERLELGLWSTTAFQKLINGIIHAWKEEGLFEAETIAGFDRAFNERKRAREEEQMRRKAEERRERKRKREMESGKAPKRMTGLDGAADEEENERGWDKEDESDQDGKENGGVKLEMGAKQDEETEPRGEEQLESAAARARRLRPKAEDMFVSDGE